MRCTVCLTRIDPVAGTIHPSCEYPEAGFTRQERAKLAGQAQARASSPSAFADALELIRAAAAGMAVLSSNDVRSAMDAAGVPMKQRGSAFTSACRRGWIEAVGHEKSAGQSAKNHDIKTYRSLIYRERAA